MSFASSPLTRGVPSQIVSVGKHSYGVSGISIASWREGANLYIGSFNSIAGGLRVFLGGNHRVDWGSTFPFGHVLQESFPNGQINGHGHPSTNGHVVIENDVWIGEGCAILSGVTIGSGSVVAAKSVVTKSVPPYAIVGGNPAKLIRFRFTDEIINQLLALKWWDLDDSVIDSIVPLLQSPMSSATIARITDMVAQATDTAPS